jgi:hypothetical protein
LCLSIIYESRKQLFDLEEYVTICYDYAIMTVFLKNKHLLHILLFVMLLFTTLPSINIGFDNDTTRNFVYVNYFGLRSLDLGFMISFELQRTLFRPLYDLSFTVDCLLFSDHVLMFRLENIVLLLLMFWMFLKLCPKLGLSYKGTFIAAVFLIVHPSLTASLYYQYFRSDIVVGLLLASIFFLYASSWRDRKYFPRFYWLSVFMYLLLIFWKENAFVVIFLLPILDCSCSWNSASLKHKLIAYLPFLALTIFSFVIRSVLYGGLGFDDLSFAGGVNRIINAPQAAEEYARYLWGSTAIMLPILGLLLSGIAVLISFRYRSLLVLLVVLILLVPYLITSSSYLHVFVPLMGLSIWAGFIGEDLALKKSFPLRIAIMTFAIMVLICWMFFYVTELPTLSHNMERRDRIIQYIARLHPDPPADTVFRLDGIKLSLATKQDEKKTEIINMLLRLKYKRMDVSIAPFNEYPGYDVHIRIPQYLLE